MQDRMRVGKQAQAERADDNAGREIAEHRTEPDALEDRDGDDARRKQCHDLNELGS